MFLEYRQLNTFVHRLDVRTKGLGFLVLTTAAFLFSNPVYNLILLMLCIALATLVQMPLARIIRILKPLLPIFIIIIIVTAVSYPPDKFEQAYSQTILFHLWRDFAPCTVGGILYGMSLSLRILTMVIVSTILTFTTPIDDFLLILRMIRVPYKIAFIITTGIRFIPTMESKVQQIIDAQRTRGADFHSGGLIRKIRAYIPVMVPMIVESIRMSENLAMAMLNRGFGATRQWTVVKELKPDRNDFIVSTVLIMMVTGIIYLKQSAYGIL